jgi:hypothetical protein
VASKCEKKARLAIVTHFDHRSDPIIQNDPIFQAFQINAWNELALWYQNHYRQDTSDRAVVGFTGANGARDDPQTVTLYKYELLNFNVFQDTVKLLAHLKISSKETIDHVQSLIRSQFLQSLTNEIKGNLGKSLGLEGKDGEYYADRFGVETTERIEEHQRLVNDQERLVKAWEQIKKLQREIC